MWLCFVCPGIWIDHLNWHVYAVCCKQSGHGFSLQPSADTLMVTGGISTT